MRKANGWSSCWRFIGMERMGNIERRRRQEERPGGRSDRRAKASIWVSNKCKSHCAVMDWKADRVSIRWMPRYRYTDWRTGTGEGNHLRSGRSSRSIGGQEGVSSSRRSCLRRRWRRRDNIETNDWVGISWALRQLPWQQNAHSRGYDASCNSVLLVLYKSLVVNHVVACACIVTPVLRIHGFVAKKAYMYSGTYILINVYLITQVHCMHANIRSHC